jgi:murein DD-endopeptidase MepM/ murein hydrolase activator NlpD
LDRNSQFSGPRARNAIAATKGARNLPQLYVPAGKGRLPELYMRDAHARQLVSRLKWFISTCLVGAAGLCIIGIAMYASTDMEDGSGMYGSLKSAALGALKAKGTGNLIGEKVALPGQKTDKIPMTTKGLTTRYTIQDSVVERRNAREFISVKPYIRITASLSTEQPEGAESIPTFNPFDLYVEKSPDNKKTVQADQSDRAPHNQFMAIRIVDLAGGFLPEEDGQLLNDDDIERHVAEADAIYAESAAQLRPGINAEGEAAGDQANAGGEPQTPAAPAKLAYTTVLEKIQDEDDQFGNSDQRSVIVNEGDTLVDLLENVGAESWQAQAINETLTSAGLKLRPGQEVRLEMAPAATDTSVKEPVKISVFTGIKAEATAVRTADGEYSKSTDHIEIKLGAGGKASDGVAERASLYTSIYSAAMAQNLSRDDTVSLLRVFSYDLDYKQKVRPGDGFEMFFDVEQAEEGTEKPGELLFVSMNAGGELMKYYRFRTPDGVVDFYNPQGSNSRKFLMRKPISAGRFTSGFGYRRHPLLGINKMHTGIDWAAPVGTPIFAAGNGTIELAGRHGGNGNYVRIRHGNGYKTAYSHMSRFGAGVKTGAKVRLGDLIGYVGTTGLSTGPHLHYEVLINSRFTNPLKLHVPRSRQLNGRMLAEFRKEMVRIDELMHRSPVKTRVAAAKD